MAFHFLFSPMPSWSYLVENCPLLWLSVSGNIHLEMEEILFKTKIESHIKRFQKSNLFKMFNSFYPDVS